MKPRSETEMLYRKAESIFRKLRKETGIIAVFDAEKMMPTVISDDRQPLTVAAQAREALRRALNAGLVQRGRPSVNYHFPWHIAMIQAKRDRLQANSPFAWLASVAKLVGVQDNGLPAGWHLREERFCVPVYVRGDCEVFKPDCTNPDGTEFTQWIAMRVRAFATRDAAIAACEKL